MCRPHHHTIPPSSCHYQSAQPTEKPPKGTRKWPQEPVSRRGRWRSAALCLPTALLSPWRVACWLFLLFQRSSSSCRPKRGSSLSATLRSQVSCQLKRTWPLCCAGKTREWFDFWLSDLQNLLVEKDRMCRTTQMELQGELLECWIFNIVGFAGQFAAVIRRDSALTLRLTLLRLFCCWSISRLFQGWGKNSGQEGCSSNRIRKRFIVSYLHTHWGLSTKTCSQWFNLCVFSPNQLFSSSSTRWSHIVQSLRRNWKVISLRNLLVKQ